MDVFIYDDLHPEDIAMLQALYSRSPDTVLNHVEKVRSSDRGKFMEKFYIGYGHASIGDCGTFTLFIEQVSMLAAKAIQNNCLYNGQEASTRYLDFSKQEFLDIYENPYTKEIQDEWKKIYFRTLDALIKNISLKYPFNPESYKTEKGWQSTMKARAFDVARSLLPLGTTTLLSWSTNLRQARDNLIRLKSHPSREIKRMAKTMFDEVVKKYTASFNGNEFNDDYEYYKPRNEYADKWGFNNHCNIDEKLIKAYDIKDYEIDAMKKGALIARKEAINIHSINVMEDELLATRPKGAPLPQYLDSYGRYNLLYMIDMGSFRDIQRHRNGVCQIPLMTAKYGFNQWYLGKFKELLSENAYAQLMTDIENQLEKISKIEEHVKDANLAETQYYYPMGLNVLTHMSYSLPQMIYVSELRSGKTVHPSLRPIAQQMATLLQHDFPNIKVYADMDEEAWLQSDKRGTQTITLKSA